MKLFLRDAIFLSWLLTACYATYPRRIDRIREHENATLSIPYDNFTLPSSECLNISLTTTMFYPMFYDFNSSSVQFLSGDLIYYLFNNGDLIDSSNTSSVVCYENLECLYLLIHGHGNFIVSMDEHVLEKGSVKLNTPALLRFGNCIDECGMNLVIAGEAGESYKMFNDTEMIEEETFIEPSIRTFCIDPMACSKLLGGVSFLLAQGSTVQKGNTHNEIKIFGNCRAYCLDGPVLVDNNLRSKLIIVVLSSVSDTSSLAEMDSPEYKAACWLIHDDLRDLQGSDPTLIQRYILALLYFTMEGDDWYDKHYFLGPSSECDWNNLAYDQFNQMYFNKGIHCDERGMIKTVMLAEKNLKGILLKELAWLLDLKYLNLGDNDIRGTIPGEYGSLKYLEAFILQGTGLTGSIPASIFQLKNLQRIFLNECMLTGELSEFDSDQLDLIQLQGNMFTGSIPSRIAPFTVQHLALYNNLLTGTIPNSFTEFKYLHKCYMHGNQLSGSIPQLFNSSYLQSLSLDHNLLTGSIPNEIATGSILKEMRLDYNLLTGTIPTEFANLLSINTLRVDHNLLSGNFPSNAELTTLRRLFLDYNNITGLIPFTNCSQFDFLQADCDSPQKVTCECCFGCNGIFIPQSKVFPCPHGRLKFVFDDLFVGQYIAFHVQNVARQVVVDPVLFYADSTTVEYESETCISLTDCYTIVFYYYMQYPLNLKVFIDEKNVLTQLVDITWNYVMNWQIDTEIFFGYSETGLQKDVCDSYELCNTSLTTNSSERSLLNKLVKFISVEKLRDNSTLEHKSSCEWNKYLGGRTSNELKNSQHLQQFVLVLFYFMTNGDHWFQNDLWLSSEPPCAWYGVTCNDYGIVTRVDLRSNNLDGIIISSIGELRGLQSLILTDNQLVGTIPIQIVQLLDLEEIHLSSNHLNGIIPSEIVFNTKLTSIDLSKNNLDGFIPDDIGRLSDLKEFDLHNNSFGGEMPDSFYNLRLLSKLSLNDNLFTGDISWLATLAELELLDLSNNYFEGKVSFSSQQSKLRSVRMFGNSFSGTISGLSGMPLLTELMMYDNELTGTLPSEIGNLPSLTHVSFSYNSLKGAIPDELFQLENLVQLQFHANSIEGDADKFDYPIYDYVTDCGGTATTEALVECTTCSHCCNDQGECLFLTATWPPARFLDRPFCAYNAVWVMTFCVFFFVFLLLRCFGPYLKKYLPNLSRSTRKTFQEDSVYRFFLTKSFRGWSMATGTVLLQLIVIMLFVRASDKTYGDNDLEYLHSCPDDNTECSSSSNINVLGWVIFSVILLFHLAKDFIESFLLIYESILVSSLKEMIAGFTVLGVTILTVVASVLYNRAISTSDTEVLCNTVILLFLNDLDEKLYEAVLRIFPEYVEFIENELEISHTKKNILMGVAVDDDVDDIEQLKRDVDQMKTSSLNTGNNEVETLKREIQNIRRSVDGLSYLDSSVSREQINSFLDVLNTAGKSVLDESESGRNTDLFVSNLSNLVVKNLNHENDRAKSRNDVDNGIETQSQDLNTSSTPGLEFLTKKIRENDSIKGERNIRNENAESITNEIESTGMETSQSQGRTLSTSHSSSSLEFLKGSEIDSSKKKRNVHHENDLGESTENDIESRKLTPQGSFLHTYFQLKNEFERNISNE